MTSGERVLSFAVGNNQLTVVVLAEGRVITCESWRRVMHLPTAARSILRTSIASHEPSLLVCERPYGACRKYGANLQLLRTLVQAAEDDATPHRLLDRPRRYGNRFEEAQVLAARFPEMATWCQVPRTTGEKEPRGLLYFEALAYAVEVLDETNHTSG